MLYFDFANYKEFAARKNNAQFIESINATRCKLRTYQKAQNRAKASEKKSLASKATDILFSEPQQAIAAIRKALEQGEYPHLNLNAKEVTMAYVIVINNHVCTVGKSLDSAKWNVKPCRTITALITSLEQKRDLVARAQKLIDSGKLPECENNARKYVARIISEYNESNK